MVTANRLQLEEIWYRMKNLRSECHDTYVIFDPEEGGYFCDECQQICDVVNKLTGEVRKKEAPK